ncbi:MAG: DegV family protein [Gemmatimonadota bacterium]
MTRPGGAGKLARQMPLRYLDGIRLRRAATAAARWVSQRQENLNGINVFPVADGDTGTNLAATLVSAVERAQRLRGRAVGPVSRALADGALYGACGNSGAILAQFFEGFAGGLEGRRRAGATALAAAAARASAAAQAALERPREGTILSVMRAWSDRFATRGAVEGADLLEVFRDSLDAAHEALARTPQQLRELAAAGVVDAGAQGFVYFLEGILHFAEGRLAGAVIEDGDHAAPLERAVITEAPQDITFRYCTECLVEGDALSLPALRDAVSALGDSLVVAGSPRRIRIHIHTDSPNAVFTAARAFGVVVHTKADDMHAQHRARFTRGLVAIVTDTAADLPERELQRLRIHAVPLRVLLGSKVYLDKQTLRPDEIYERLTRGERSVRTSQPAAGDYAALYAYLFEHYAAVVAPSLSGGLSGTIQAARTAAASVDDARITVLDTGTASIAQGLIVQAAAECALAGGGVEAVVAATEDAKRRVRFQLAVPTLEYILRSGRVAGWKVGLAQRLGLVPILSIRTDSGALRLARLARRGRVHRTALAAVRRLVRAEATPPERIWIAHAAAPSVAESYRAALARTAPDAELSVLEVGPALGAHTGPGAVAVAYLAAPPR